MKIPSINNNYHSRQNAKPAFKAVKIQQSSDFNHPMEVLALAKAIKGGVKQLAEDVEVQFYAYCKDNRLKILGVQVYDILPKNPTRADRQNMIDTMQIGHIEIGGATLTPNQILHKVVELKERRTGTKISVLDIPDGDKYPDEWNINIFQAHARLMESLK